MAEPTPSSTPWWQQLKNAILRRIAATLLGFVLLAGCGKLPVGVRPFCTQLVALVQGAISSDVPSDPLQQFRDRAGATAVPAPDDRPVCPADHCTSTHYAPPLEDGGSCRCAR